MRQSQGSPVIRRIAAVAIAAALMFSLVAPVLAGAASTPQSTLRASTRLMSKAKRLTLSGRINKKLKGKYVIIEIRKPNRPYWQQISSRRISKSGTWAAWKYTPQVAGTYYFRVRYANRVSRTATLRVRRGTGRVTNILLASTTSTRDSGLFERLGPAFLHAAPEYKILATFVGSGKSIELGAKGDADVVLTHSPAAEEDWVLNRYYTNSATPPLRLWAPFAGKNRHSVMYNDYVIIGPHDNPAGVLMTDTPAQAFAKIWNGSYGFQTRNDNSGTHAKEKWIWAKAGIAPVSGSNGYTVNGTPGMAQAINYCLTSDLYTIADRATWLQVKGLGQAGTGATALAVWNAGDPDLFNPYSVIETVGARNAEGAMDFSNWLRSAEAQALIKSYGEYTYPGQVMFVPWAGAY